MRYEKGHKERTRQRIIEVASAEFRKKGLARSSVAGIMARAGLTQGGFYSHFDSKEELLREAVDLAARNSRIARGIAEGKSLVEIIESYLNASHRDHPEKGCAISALVEEASRGGQRDREHFALRIARMAAMIEGLLPEDKADRRETALAIFALIIGALQLARATSDQAISDQILSAGAKKASALAR